MHCIICQIYFFFLFSVLNDSFRIYTDIDECYVGTHDCDVNANCSNIIGSYDCTCKTSYFGNGRQCEGKHC